MSEEDIKKPEGEDTQFVKVDLWLNMSKSGKAVMFDNNKEKFPTGKSLIEKLIDKEDDEVKTVTFSHVVDEDEFETSDYFLSTSDSGKAVVLNYHDTMFVMPVQQVERLLEGEIDGSPFFLPIGNE